jgi:hypothetical protein
MLDECREEFGVTVKAQTRAKAYEALREDYPESHCVQLESHLDTMKRERRQYRQAQRDYDRDY